MMWADELGERYGQGPECPRECSAEGSGVCGSEPGDGIEQSLVRACTQEG